ncbi:type VI secretion system protein TssA [Pseudomonas vranovensis]|uniref:type VI secretion system protein TssA n=1 Tax=Pseudomonas vranovensis TaxID=321661 RepID=UPI00048C9469|nr:type VI secretion system protein TssA [Pseudomonas vranovensis]
MNINNFIGVLASEGCGEDLEYDVDFVELNRLIAGGEEVQYGEHVYIPEPIDWVAVESLALKLFQRTHDLRVGVCLTRAWLAREGILGFANGLQVLAFLLDERWDTVHPQLSALEQFDPWLRINGLAELVVPGTVIKTLRRAPLVGTATQGLLTVGDLALIASGVDSAERKECQARLEHLIEPHCSAELMRSLGLLNRLEAQVQKIGRCLDDRTGLSAVSPLQPLLHLLQQCVRVVDERVRSTAQGAVPASEPCRTVDSAKNAVAVQSRSNDKCHSREDVYTALEAVEAYYKRYEPSSPIPMLVHRMRRLVDMDFMELIAELAPSSIQDIRTLCGIQDE